MYTCETMQECQERCIFLGVSFSFSFSFFLQCPCNWFVFLFFSFSFFFFSCFLRVSDMSYTLCLVSNPSGIVSRRFFLSSPSNRPKYPTVYPHSKTGEGERREGGKSTSRKSPLPSRKYKFLIDRFLINSNVSLLPGSG